MFLKLFSCWCIPFLFLCVETQDSGFDSRFSNNWNSNRDFSVSNNRPYFEINNNAESNYFSSNEKLKKNNFFSAGNEKNFNEETILSNDKTSNWNPKKPIKANNDRQLNAYNNGSNKKKPNFNTDLPNSLQWSDNYNSFTSNSNKQGNPDFSSWGYNSVKPTNQSKKKPKIWNYDIRNNKTNGNDIFSNSDHESNSEHSYWSLNSNEKTKPISSFYSDPEIMESTTKKSNKNFGNSKWEASYNNKPQKASESSTWEINDFSQSEGKKSSSNFNLSGLDTSVLDEMDKNDWYFGKESNYPKPPFRPTLNIDVSELWNFDKNRKNNLNSRNENSAKINNNNSNRRNRQVEYLSGKMGGIHCECVSVNLCEVEDMIITQKDANFEFRPQEKFICERLTDVCCLNPKIKKLTDRENFRKENERLQCGQTQVEENHFKSFDDNVAEPGEFPWILKLETLEINCSASLIYPNMALTAAHCVNSAQDEGMTLQAGVWDSENEFLQSRRVKKIIIHPDYNSRNPRNDIALLVLKTPFELTDNVNTICLPMANDRWNLNECLVAGWRSKKIIGQEPEVLEKEIINFLPQAECQNVMLVTDLWRNYILHDSFICGLGRSNKKSCIGDEGGFVICPFKNQPRTYLQIGIVSMGINCDNFGRPGIFTNVLKFLDWINQNYLELSGLDYSTENNKK